MITYYSVTCNDYSVNGIYVGSTSNYAKRISSHKSCCKSGKNMKLYNYIIDNGGFDNWQFNILSLGLFVSKEIRYKKEQFYIDFYKADLNCNSAVFDKENVIKYRRVYRAKNIEAILQKKCEVYIKNKEVILQQNKNWKAKNKESTVQYQKEYRAKNKESMVQYQKEYKANNKESISQYNKEYRAKNVKT